MSTTRQYKIEKLPNTLGGFQNFYLCPPELEKRLKEENIEDEGEWEKWIWIHLHELDVGIIGRMCETRVLDDSDKIRCELRVWKLFSHFPGSGSGSGTAQVDRIDNAHNNDLKSCEDKVSPFLKGELDELEFCVARHVVRLERKYNVMMENSLRASRTGTGTGIDSVFNSNYKSTKNPFTTNSGSYICTSEDIKLLRVGTVETMTVSVIFSSAQKQSSNQDETSTTSLDFLLAEKTRDILEANAIVVSERTLVDVRQCPLALSSFSIPAIAYLYIEDCHINFKSSPAASGSKNKSHQHVRSLAGRVNLRTRVVMNRRRVHDVNYYMRLFASSLPSTVSLAGLEGPIKFLEDMMRLQEQELDLLLSGGKSDGMDVGHFSHGFLIAGSPGCGKRLVVHEAAKKLRANLLVLNLADRDFSIQDVLRFGDSCTKVFSSAITSARASPTILLMEQLEVLSVVEGKSQESSTALAKAKLVNHLCELFDAIPKHVRLSVVLISNKPHLIPQKLRRAGRLQHELYIKVPNVSDRHSIIKSLTQDIQCFKNFDLGKLARETPAYSGADLERLIHLIALRANEEEMRQVSDSDLKYGLSRVVPSLLQGSLGLVGNVGMGSGTGSSLDDISGLRSVKLDLIKGIVWPLKYPNAFLTMAIHPPKGILLYGPPGCAKTSLVRAIAGSHQTNFLSVSGAELFASGVGESEKIISDLFHRARSASPSVLFIDELEAIVGSRQSSSKGKSISDTILSTFLTEMDGIGTSTPISTGNQKEKQAGNNTLSGPHVVVVAATNRPDLIDSALLRPGRLDRIIPVPPPNEMERLELLKKLTSQMPLGEDVDLNWIAEGTERYSGADLVGLCKEAALFALEGDMGAESVMMENFRRAFAQSSPSISPQTLANFVKYQNQQHQQQQ